MKYVFLFFFLFISNAIFSQKQVLKITHQLSGKEIFIKENKRIKIKTVDGKKISGRFKIKNDLVVINDQSLKLSDIGEIKRNPLLFSILTGSIMVYGGVVSVGAGVLLGIFVHPSAFLLTIPAAALIFVGNKPPNFSKKFKTENGWIIETTTIAD